MAEKMYRGNPLVNWTPDVLGRQLAAWTHGDIREMAWVMEWIQQHDDICSTVSAKAIGAVARHGYGIELVDGVRAEQKDLAEAQREVLQDFYASVEVSHAMDVDTHGGMRLLVAQVMDGFAKGYAAHHIVWRPSANGLMAELQQVPLWFFEARSGGLRFITSPFGYEGVPLEKMGGRSAWMVSRGRGVMLAASIARLFKQIPLQDWLTYCDRHGMPGFLGKTSERKGTDGWNNLANAVRSMGAEFGAVVSAGDVIEVLDLTAQGNLPYEKLVDRMDRAMAMLWRGADLSTISQGGAGSGASLQGDETQDLDADNAAWAGETIDRNLSRTVLEWNFGKGVPQLAKLVLRTKTRDDTKLEIEKIKAAIEIGLNPDRNWAATRLSVVEADEGELGLGKSQPVIPPNPSIVTLPASNSAVVAPEDIEEAILRVTKIRAVQLNDLTDIVDEMIAAEELSDADLEAYSERIMKAIPQNLSPEATEAMASELALKMGAAITKQISQTA